MRSLRNSQTRKDLGAEYTLYDKRVNTVRSCTKIAPNTFQLRIGRAIAIRLAVATLLRTEIFAIFPREIGKGDDRALVFTLGGAVRKDA